MHRSLPWLRICLTIALVACGRGVTSTQLSLPCLQIRAATGEDYRLRYAGQSCDRLAYPDLPANLYDDVGDWAFNAQAAGFLAPLDQFRVVARLATLDPRSARGFSFHGDGFWRRYKWWEWTKSADLISSDALKDDSAVKALIETPLSQARLGHGHTMDLEFRATSLNPAVVKQLRTVLSNAESSLAEMDSMRVTRRTLEEAVMARADHATQRRATFTKFRLVSP